MGTVCGKVIKTSSTPLDRIKDYQEIITEQEFTKFIEQWIEDNPEYLCQWIKDNCGGSSEESESDFLEDNLSLRRTDFLGKGAFCTLLPYKVRLKEGVDETLLYKYNIDNIKYTGDNPELFDMDIFSHYNEGLLGFRTWDESLNKMRDLPKSYTFEFEATLSRKDGANIQGGNADGTFTKKFKFNDFISLEEGEYYYLGVVQVDSCSINKGVLKPAFAKEKMMEGNNWIVISDSNSCNYSNDSNYFKGGDKLYRFVRSTSYNTEVIFSEEICSDNIYRISDKGTIVERINCK